MTTAETCKGTRWLSGRARVAGVIGYPVRHSLSPRLHGYWLATHGIDGAYVPFAVTPEDLPSALRALPVLGVAGVNITVPHKEAALDGVDAVSPEAARIGAVNTVVVDAAGILHGSNTDAFGFRENLRETHPQWRASSGPAVVLGAGGACRAVIAALIEDGVPEVRLVNRTRARADTLASTFGGAMTPVDWGERADALAGAHLLVNTTTLGMSGAPALDITLELLPREALVTDIVYTPLMTPLLRAARDRGNPIVDGLGMLLHQARPGFEAWFGVKPAVTPALRQAVLGGLADPW